MPMGIVSGFNVATLVTTTANVTVPTSNAATSGTVATARIEGTAAGTLKLFQNGTTNATNRVCTLRCAANSADETGIPIRIQGIFKVQLSTSACTGYVYVR